MSRTRRGRIRAGLALGLAVGAVVATAGCQGDAFDKNQKRYIIRTPTPRVGPGDSVGANSSPLGQAPAAGAPSSRN